MKDQVYVRIAENVDKGILTAPKSDGEPSKAFIAYLKLVYTPEEANIAQYLSMEEMEAPKTVEELADDSGLDVDEVRDIIVSLSRKGGVSGQDQYVLPAVDVLINLHMWYPEIKEDDLKAAELYQQFFIEEGFHKYYATSRRGTPMMRTIPIKQAIHLDTETFTAEEAHAFVMGLSTEDLALIPCSCRTRTEKMGIRECKHRVPVASCVVIGEAAGYYEEIGLGKRVTKEQALAYIDEVVTLGLIPTTANSVEGPHNLMCMCCGCCCSNVRGRTRWDNPTAVRPANFIPEASDDCTLCGTCVDRCFLDALSLDEDAEKAVVDPEKCIGCGVCAVTCPQEALRLHRFERSEPTFQTADDMIVRIAGDNDRL